MATLGVARLTSEFGIKVRRGCCATPRSGLFWHCTPTLLASSQVPPRCEGTTATTAGGTIPAENVDNATDQEPLSTAPPRDAEGLPTMSLPDVRQMLQSTSQASEGFPDEVLAIASATDRVLEKIRNRVGPDGMDKLGLEVDPKTIIAEMRKSRIAIDEILKYIEYSTLVMERNFVGELQAECLESVEIQPNDTDMLVAFAKLHKIAMSNQLPQVECTAEVADVSLLARLSSEVRLYSQNVAHPAFQANASAFADLCISSVVGAMPKCSLVGVHSKVISAKSPHEVVPMLIVGADLQQIAFERIDAFGSGHGESILEGMPYHLKLSALKSFVQVAEVVEVLVLGVAPPSAELEPQKIPIVEALAILDAHALCCDLTSIAATLHSSFSMKFAANAKLPPGLVLDSAVHLLNLYKTTLDKAEQMMQSESAMMVERSGWRLATPFSVLRCWRDGMACFSGHVQRSLLQCWVSLLEGAIGKCKSCTPSWSVIFQSGRFDLTMAIRVLKDKLKPLTDVHNETHTLLQDSLCPHLRSGGGYPAGVGHTAPRGDNKP